MHSFRRLALLLALGMPVLQAAHTQSSSSTPQDPAQAPAQQTAASTAAATSVQARIRARREQRRIAAIRETYSHRYEAYLGGGYLRFTPGSTLQRVNEYNWNGGITRYFDERLGVTIDGRGLYGAPFIPPVANNSNVTQPAISQYAVLAGPSYRFYLQPKYSISGRVMGGVDYGNFSANTNGSVTLAKYLGLFPDGTTYAANASVVGEYNLSPSIGLRLAPEYFVSGFDSTPRGGFGFTTGIVFRFGKQ